MSPSFVIVIVIIVVVVVVIYISIDRVFFYCYHHYLLATDVTISSFCFTSICLHVRTLKYRRVSFFFSFFFQRSNVSFPLFFFSSLLYTFISHPPSHPFLSPQNYVALHIAQFSIHLIFLLTTFPYRIFPPYVRTFFHCFFEYFSLSSSYLTNASLPNPFFNFFPHSLVRAPSRMLVSSRFASLQDLEISRSSQSKKVRPKSFSRALVTDRKKPVFHAFASSSNCSMADLSSRII